MIFAEPRHTLSTAMNIYRAGVKAFKSGRLGPGRLKPKKKNDEPKPVIANEISFNVAVWDVSICVRIDVTLRETKIDHINEFVVRR